MIHIPDNRGFYRCPYRCASLNYPQPKWRTLKGIEQHMEKCLKAPIEKVAYVAPPPPDPSAHYGDCAECGEAIFEGETIWWIRDRLVCAREPCFEQYRSKGRGVSWWAGFVLPHIDEEYAA